MKTLILLLLLASTTFGQQMHSVIPVINSKEIDSIIVNAYSTTIRSVTKPFAGVAAGTFVQSRRFPIGTTVVSNTNDSILVLSNAASDTIALDSARFDVNVSLQYTAGDALGFPFQLPDWTKEIVSVTVVDTASQISSVKMVFLGENFTQIEDNSAFAISDLDSRKIINYALVDSANSFSSNRILYRPFNQVPLSLGSKTIWVQLVCVGTPTFVTNKALKFNIIVK